MCDAGRRSAHPRLTPLTRPRSRQCACLLRVLFLLGLSLIFFCSLVEFTAQKRLNLGSCGAALCRCIRVGPDSKAPPSSCPPDQLSFVLLLHLLAPALPPDWGRSSSCPWSAPTCVPWFWPSLMFLLQTGSGASDVLWNLPTKALWTFSARLEHFPDIDLPQ